jgi:hypothetical protein
MLKRAPALAILVALVMTVPYPASAADPAGLSTDRDVSAQNKQNWGAVTREILIDGETRTNSTSSGAFVIAECSNAADRR